MSRMYSNIIIEGYCLFDSRSKKEWKTYPYDLKKKHFSSISKTVINPDYISADKRPNWCCNNNKDKCPQFKCLAGIKDMCPFFGFTNCTPKEYKMFNKMYKGDQK